MQPTEHVEFELSKNLVAALDKAVAAGTYSSKNEAVQIALLHQLWQDQPLQNIEELGKLWDEGIASGRSPYFSAADIIAEARRRKGLSAFNT